MHRKFIFPAGPRAATAQRGGPPPLHPRSACNQGGSAGSTAPGGQRPLSEKRGAASRGWARWRRPSPCGSRIDPPGRGSRPGAARGGGTQWVTAWPRNRILVTRHDACGPGKGSERVAESDRRLGPPRMLHIGRQKVRLGWVRWFPHVQARLGVPGGPGPAAERRDGTGPAPTRTTLIPPPPQARWADAISAPDVAPSAGALRRRTAHPHNSQVGTEKAALVESETVEILDFHSLAPRARE